MASSVDFTPPASGAHMKGQTCFVKHVKTNMQGKKKKKATQKTAQRRLYGNEHKETHRAGLVSDARLLVNLT